MQAAIYRRSLYALVALLSVFVSGIQAQDELECESGQRVIEHAAGQICIPEQVERVVALEWTYIEGLLALGIQPVGAADIAGYEGWVKIPVGLDESVVNVGSRNEPDLEVIAELQPDLIIGVAFRMAQNYDKLSAIAPTLAFNPYPQDVTAVSQYDEMLSTFSTIASAVNREAEGEAVIEALQNTYDRAQTALENADRAGEKFILGQGWTSDSVATFRLFTDNAMAVQILEQIGFENAWDADPQLYGFVEIGIEGFTDLKDETLNFFYVVPDSDNEFLNDSPVWSSLGFVRDETSYWLGSGVWLFGGPLSAELIVETVLDNMGIELPEPEITPEATAEAE